MFLVVLPALSQHGTSRSIYCIPPFHDLLIKFNQSANAVNRKWFAVLDFWARSPKPLCTTWTSLPDFFLKRIDWTRQGSCRPPTPLCCSFSKLCTAEMMDDVNQPVGWRRICSSSCRSVNFLLAVQVVMKIIPFDSWWAIEPSYCASAQAGPEFHGHTRIFGLFP